MEPSTPNAALSRNIVVTDHALVRFLEHGSKINVPEYRRQLIARRLGSGLSDPPSDRTLLKFLKESLPVQRYRGLLVDELLVAEVVDTGRDGIRRRLSSGLIAVTDVKDQRVITVAVAVEGNSLI